MNKKIAELLRYREFVSVATSDSNGRPNAAPKFLLKIEGNYIYLVDYFIGTTFRNLSVNPRISISIMDTSSLVGYQLNGLVDILENGPEYDLLVKDLLQREVDLSARRIVEGVTKGKSHEGFELNMSENFVIFKVKIDETVEMVSSGILKREKV